MKSCPTCKRTFDESFTFCLDDGALLSPPFDPQATERMPPSSAPTEVMNSDVPPHTKPAMDLQPTMPFNPNLAGRKFSPAYSSQPRKNNVLLWLVLIIGVAILGVLIYLVAGKDNAGSTSAGNASSTPSGRSTTPSPSIATATPSSTAPPITSGNANNQRVTTQTSNTAPGGQEDQVRAEEKIQSILRRSAGGCKISKVLSVSAERTAYGWKVTARVVMSASGSPVTETAVWNVTEKYGVAAASQLSTEIERGCG